MKRKAVLISSVVAVAGVIVLVVVFIGGGITLGDDGLYDELGEVYVAQLALGEELSRHGCTAKCGHWAH